MKIIASILCLTVLTLSACRGGGGPATRVGRGIDHAFYKTGQGIEKVGRKIEGTAH
ncbi:hypothetical protein [Prosthecobacter sp.]|uniref:hypothetical protein n=1 Tax=Prosthecobacter sp. TaxID=1965333 RepID=UPI001D705478|nr:hypothetical protein [Prosthecobacter sp.]MCB1276507.1 hypothetical protein [Prosthecobacter sp.]